MLRGRVIRIISNKQLILNIGEEDGVNRKMKFVIYSPTEVIVDHQTGEQLGDYRVEKVTVEVDQLYEHFCIASRPYKFRDNQPPWYDDDDVGEPHVWPDLPVDIRDIEPLGTGTTVSVGDLAEEEVLVDTADFPVSADDEIPF